MLDVIIPVFNNLPLVRDCLASIMSASCRTSYELIVIDDASTEYELKIFLEELAREKKITLHTNPINLGFTRTVNLGMSCHRDRDVVLLNSDTKVYGDWLDRLRRGGYSHDKIGTVNPLTNSNGSHITYYPKYAPSEHISVEVTDDVLNDLASERNDSRFIEVYVTVGFCMYIKRACLDDVGFFDSENFPVGYGEESDFCYRARKLGWRHLAVGDAFVTHLEGKSFGPRKEKLMKEMFEKFVKLHPDAPELDRSFRQRDPLRTLRTGLDLARVRRLLRGIKKASIHVCNTPSDLPVELEDFGLVYCSQNKSIVMRLKDQQRFPNLIEYQLPRDIARLNKDIQYLGIEIAAFASSRDREILSRDVVGLPFEIDLDLRLEVLERS